MGALGSPMGNYPKYDHAPLLAPGRHYLSLVDVEALCVHQFTGETRGRRETLFHGLEELIQRLLVANIRCDVFIDGSFLTEKPEPDDVDVIVSTEIYAFERLSENQMQALEAINQYDSGTIDSSSWTTYPRGHDYFGAALDLGNAGEQYGIEHGRVWLKGYVVIRLWETDVGNRICRRTHSQGFRFSLPTRGRDLARPA
jgi:hypothetical protein